MSESATELNAMELMPTNVEKRVPAYSETEPPTVPSEVGPDTPLDSLRLNWRERDLPERTRTKHVHRLHPYLGKFIPQLAEVFLRKYFRPEQTVLDPFCGSGTTLVQANELGVDSLGYDISAFNVLLTQTKVREYDVGRARTEVLDSLDRLRWLTQSAVQLGFWQERAAELQIPQTDNDYLRRWFAPRALNELLTYRSLIQNEGYLYQDLLRVILSRSARSARLTTHFDLDFPKKPQVDPYWCYKHSRTCNPTTEAFKFISRYSLDTLRRIEQFAGLRTSATSRVYHEDSRRCDFPSIDGIITSPPYVGLIDYHDQHAYAYHLLGLRDRRGDEIGPAVNGSSRKAQGRYQLDIAEVFRHAVESMRPGGWIIVIIHDRSKLYPEIASLCGVEVVAELDRHVNRRTGRRSSEFFESIFVWRKA